MVYVNTEEKIKKVKLEKDNFYVVADFDQTLTEGTSESTWGILASANDLGGDYIRKRNDLYEYYRPIEIDSTISNQEKSEAMNTWWKAHINLFFEYGLKEDAILKGINSGNLKYRDGAKEFLHKMQQAKVPVIIISAGIGNIIQEFFKHENDLLDNMHIISNYIEFQDGYIKTIKGETIHALNKNIVNLEDKSKRLLENRKNILLLGDGLADLKMVSEKDIENTITVGFLEERVEENLEYFNKAFDIVITNKGSFKDVNDILKLY